MHTAISFGDLRAATQAPPTRASWCALTNLLERAKPWRDPRRWREIELPYLQRALSRWPTALRRAPSRWLRAVGEGEELPALALARTLSVDDDLAHWWLTRDGQLSRWHLLQSPWLSGIRALTLHDSKFDALFVHQLAAAPHLCALRHLDLSRNQIGPEACGALVDSSLIGRLTHLDLSLNPLGEGITHLARAPQTSLRHLDLSCTGVDDEGARALARASGLRGLHTLTLHGNAMSHYGWSTLKGSPNVPFSPTPHSTQSIAARERADPEWSRILLRNVRYGVLRGGGQWTSMCEDLEDRSVDPHWFADTFAYLERTTSLGSVELPRVASRTALARALHGNPSPTLHKLDLSYNHITSLGLHHLREHARWPRLREVRLGTHAYQLRQTASETEGALIARAQHEVTP